MAPACLCALMTTSGHTPEELVHVALVDLQTVPDQGISEPWTVCGGVLRPCMYQYVTSQRCSVGFRSEEQESHSVTSVLSSSRKCVHIMSSAVVLLQEETKTSFLSGMSDSLSPLCLTIIRVLLVTALSCSPCIMTGPSSSSDYAGRHKPLKSAPVEVTAVRQVTRTLSEHITGEE